MISTEKLKINTPPTRSIYVDIMKAMAIAGVVMVHIHGGLNDHDIIPAQRMIEGWSVVLFYVISGFFVKESSMLSLWPFIKKKFRTVFLPGLLITIIGVLLHNLFFKIGFYSETFDYHEVCRPFTLADWKTILIHIAVFTGEPCFGTQWFLYELFFAFVGYSVIYKVLHCVVCDRDRLRYVFTACLVALSTTMFVIQKHYGILIPRFNQVFSIMLLINLGFYVNQVWKWKFNNIWLVLISVFYLWEEGALHYNVGVNSNNISSIPNLIFYGLCSCYAVGYIAKKVGQIRLSRHIAFLGESSLWIMLLHVISFKVATGLLMLVGIKNCGLLTNVAVVDNLLSFVLYLLIGLYVPTLMRVVYRGIKDKFSKAKTNTII